MEQVLVSAAAYRALVKRVETLLATMGDFAKNLAERSAQTVVMTYSRRYFAGYTEVQSREIPDREYFLRIESGENMVLEISMGTLVFVSRKCVYPTKDPNALKALENVLMQFSHELLGTPITQGGADDLTLDYEEIPVFIMETLTQF